MKHTLIALAALSSSLTFAAAYPDSHASRAEPAPAVRRWMSAASVRSDFWSMFDAPAAWDSVRRMIDVFSIHVNAITSRTDSATLVKAAALLRGEGILVDFECGGLRPFSGCDSLAGERQASSELVNMWRWLTAGGTIDFVTMDSPINTMIAGGDPSGTCGWSVARAAYEMVDYMKAVRAVIPAVEFALVEPVPWYHVGSYPSHPGNDYGDLIKTLDTVITVVEQRGEQLVIFHSDSPYEYSENTTTHGWLKIKAVEDYVHSRGVRHGRISNSEGGGSQSDSLFFVRTLAAANAYAAVGGKPDEVEVWCWYPHPAVNVPDSLPYTFTYTCRKFFAMFPDSAPPAPRIPLLPAAGRIYHGVGQSNTGVPEYIAALADSSIHPIVHNFYYDIPGTRGDKFDQLRQQLAAERAIGRIPHLSIAMTDGPNWTDSIIATSTRYDYIIDSIAKVCAEFPGPMFIRPGFEFGGTWFPYHPYVYPVAYRKIASRIRAARGADSTAILWCWYSAAPNDFDSVDARGPRWYPGDSSVDWFSLDVFFPGDFHPDSASNLRRGGGLTAKGKSERFLSMARAHGKPVYLSELSAAGVNLTADTSDGRLDWNAWFDPFVRFLALHPEIQGFNYTNWDWSQTGQYKTWGNAQIGADEYVREHWIAEMHKPQYIHLPYAGTSGVEETGGRLPSSDFAIYPNPIVAEAMTSIMVHRRQRVTLSLYDAIGRVVRTLVDEELAPGTHAFTLDAKRLGLRTGVYACRLKMNGTVATKMMVVVGR